MAEIHHLIRHQGIEEARRQAVSKHERMVVEAAYQVLSDDAERMGFTYSGFALTSLPHKPQECPCAWSDGPAEKWQGNPPGSPDREERVGVTSDT